MFMVIVEQHNICCLWLLWSKPPLFSYGYCGATQPIFFYGYIGAKPPLILCCAFGAKPEQTTSKKKKGKK
jgi:hypothetical protein